jgi:hypothetical protein
LIQLVVNGQTYNYPENRDSPSWGEEATAWAEAVTDVLNNFVGDGDIIPTVASISNNQSAATNVAGLFFNTASVRGAIVEYTIYRNTTGIGATELVETGSMCLGYKSVAGTWTLSILGGGGAGVTFSVLNTGQVQYTSTDITGSSYSGTIKFRARALTQ